MGPWMFEIVLITLRDLKIKLPGGLAFTGTTANNVKGLPLPADYLASFIIFAPIVALQGTRAKTVASLFGWGIVLSTLLNALDPTNPLGKKPTPAASGGTTNG